MSAGPADFNGLARCYRWLEMAAFGRDLERTRFALLDRLASARELLVLGEGDGRCLARLVHVAPHARIHCIDASEAMLNRAAARLTDSPARQRVRFERADIFARPWPPATYDAVVTLFFLDCFSPEAVAQLVARITATLRTDARWLYADFAEPAQPLARWRARAWLTVLYAFFRWQTGLRTRHLPPAEQLIAAAGFSRRAVRTLNAGLLRTVLFERGAP